jgi:hypothetical protein
MPSSRSTRRGHATAPNQRRGESYSSKRYSNGGKTVGYRYRTRGPVYPVRTGRVDPATGNITWDTNTDM